MYDEVESFLNYLVVERGGPSNTLGAHQNDLRQFIEFAERKMGNGNGNGNGKKGKVTHGWQTIDLDLLTEYVSHLRNNQGYRDSTTARKVAALKSFFSFMVDEGTLKDNPAEFLVSPRVGRTLPKHLTEEETERLLDQPAKRGTVEGQRDLAMLELLYATGLRVSELTSLNLEDVNLQESYIRCLGKGGKERLVYMHPHATDVVQDYLDNARPVLLSGKDEDAVFLNRRGERLTRQWVWTAIKGYAKDGGIEKDITPHTLRHSFATHMLRGGASLRHVQTLLGHASMATTQVYTHLTDEHVHAEFEKSHPRA